MTGTDILSAATDQLYEEKNGRSASEKVENSDQS
jgi:hypothetical protein